MLRLDNRHLLWCSREQAQRKRNRHGIKGHSKNIFFFFLLFVVLFVGLACFGVICLVSQIKWNQMAHFLPAKLHPPSNSTCRRKYASMYFWHHRDSLSNSSAEGDAIDVYILHCHGDKPLLAPQLPPHSGTLSPNTLRLHRPLLVQITHQNASFQKGLTIVKCL